MSFPVQEQQAVSYKGDIMPIDKDQLRKLVTDVLIVMRLYSKNAVELLMLTAAQESHCGTYLEQINGPAQGIFQMEPNTHSDIYANYLKYKPELRTKLHRLMATYGPNLGFDLNMRGNIIYQIAMARVFYLRFPEPLPSHLDVDALAKYYKKYWNTELGKATVMEAKNNYMRFAV